VVGLIIGLLVGLLMGFVVGTRARKMVAALKAAAQAMKNMMSKSSAAAAAAADGAAEPEEDEEEEEDANLNQIDPFLNNEIVPGLDDHADIAINPIVLYKIKIAKEEARKELRRAQLIADGYDPDAMDEDMANAAAGAAGAVKKNALLTLIEAGARVTALAASANAETQAREERKRALRTVDAYLSKTLEVDTTKTDGRLSKASNTAGSKAMNALQIANLSASMRAGGEKEARDTQLLTTAKDAREQLREFQRLTPLAVQVEQERNSQKTVERRGGALPTSHEDIAAGLAKLEQELEGEESEEGEEDDDEDLEA